MESEMLHNEAEIAGHSMKIAPVDAEPLFKRFARPQSPILPLVYEFSDDPGLLHQYYYLRQDLLNRSWGVPYVQKLEDDFDKISHTLVVRMGRQVVGGFRMIVREEGEGIRLPMEIKGFDLREALPEMHLRDRRHAEISRFVVLEDFRDPAIVENMVKLAVDKSMELGLQYCFCFSQLHRSRMWRKFVNHDGRYHATISRTVFPPVPDICGDMQYYLSVFERVAAEARAVPYVSSGQQSALSLEHV